MVAIDTDLHIVNKCSVVSVRFNLKAIMWWGYSQALDLLEESSDLSSKKTNQLGQEIGKTHNLLLIGQSDCRHVLKTIARKFHHKEYDKVKFYLYEPLLENVARELLFLTLALEPPEHIGIAEKTLFFMELYGNSLLRPAASNYLIKVSKRLLNAITNFNYSQQILPSVCLEKLKYKERDQLEVIFKYWALNEKSFDILTSWDERLRKHLGVRYDCRSGVYDWDYHMRYHCFGADILHLQEYKRFREKGIAFYFDDTDPCISNITLASAVFPVGTKIHSYGYLGDILTGPYVTFGLNCEDKDMFKKVNGQMRKTATHVTERNMMRIFHEIEHKTPFVALPEDENECAVALLKDETSKLKIRSDSTCESEASKIKIKDSSTVYQSLSTNNCEIVFLPTSALNDLPNKSEYDSFFDTAFIAQPIILKQIKPNFFKILKHKGKVIVDTPKFLLNYRKEDLKKFKNELETLMAETHCKISHPYNYEKDEFVRFTVER